MILVDTNVFLRYIDKRSSDHARARALLLNPPGDLIVAPQSVYEAYSVLTRPVDVNGLGVTPAQADQLIDRITFYATLVEEPSDLLERWRRLCVEHDVGGRPSHDARLAAFALGVGARTLMTLNPRDFRRYGLEIIDQP